MQAPADSQCAYHPGTLAANICGRCGSFICVVCSSVTGSGVFCPRCHTPTLARGSRGARFVANLIDSFVVGLPAMALFFVGLGLMAAAGKGGERAEDLLPLAMMGGMVVGLGIGLAVQIVMQVKYGQSVGKRLFKLKVVRTDGSPVELWRIILLRNVALQVAAQLCGFVGIVDALMIFGAEERCLHDLIAETIVIDVSADG
ncbi:MAG: RDD family protein [Myxococcaceae bacterium]|nr:RDD family protein [Myxococcaceae bacterium]